MTVANRIRQLLADVLFENEQAGVQVKLRGIYIDHTSYISLIKEHDRGYQVLSSTFNGVPVYWVGNDSGRTLIHIATEVQHAVAHV